MLKYFVNQNENVFFFFFLEQLKTTCNFTTLNTIAQNKNSKEYRQYIFLAHHVEIEII